MSTACMSARTRRTCQTTSLILVLLSFSFLGASCFSPMGTYRVALSTRAARSSLRRCTSSTPSSSRTRLMMVEPQMQDPIELVTNIVLQVGGAFALATVLSSALDKFAKSKSKPPKGVKEGGVDWEALLGSGKLSGEAYKVLRNQGTERPFTSPLLAEERAGVFACAACGESLFKGATKFDSGTGWPSFYDKLEGVELEEGNMVDQTVNMRQEVHCSNCGGHLGHVFPDGVMWRVPTGKRYCINGVALKFNPGEMQTEDAN